MSRARISAFPYEQPYPHMDHWRSADLKDFYATFLTILLLDRATRDDKRCRKKYGADWDEYCRRVPWKIIPGIY